MNSQKEQSVLDALRAIKDPDLGKNIVELGFIKDLKVNHDSVSFAIELTTPACPVRDQMKSQAEEAVLALPEFKKVDVKMTARVRPSAGQKREALLPLVKNIIPVASGKGGVGKSTVSANLAVALAQMGAKVGLMDADVYGPSIPKMMGVTQAPKVLPENRVVPPEAHGVKIISMGFFVRPTEAVVWRGPMLHKTVQQFLGNVEWGELDYLIIDLPPGTGDIQLSICQSIPLTGAAIVSTPQDVALSVAEKAIIMFSRLNTKVLGLIENMSGFVCPRCGKVEDIFGSGGAESYSQQNKIPFLGKIPLDTQIRKMSDSGNPIVIKSPESISGQAFRKIAQNLAAQVSIRNLQGDSALGPVIQNITIPHPSQVRIIWNDKHESLYSALQLRLACRCAGCLDEMTGKKRIGAEALPDKISLQRSEPVGEYAHRFYWSDNHSTGIYTFEYLRSLCPCFECSAKSKSEIL